MNLKNKKNSKPVIAKTLDIQEQPRCINPANIYWFKVKNRNLEKGVKYVRNEQ